MIGTPADSLQPEMLIFKADLHYPWEPSEFGLQFSSEILKMNRTIQEEV